MSIDVNSYFKLSRNLSLSGEDYHSLTNMYLPIMGIDSFSLYIYLFNLRDGETYQFKKLIDALNLYTPTFLEKAFSKLEALSLVNLYFNEQKGYIVLLNPPLSREAFLDNTLLATFLRMQIGEVEYNKLTPQNISLRGYKNITKAFDDVYAVKESSVENIFNKIFKVKSKKDVVVNNLDFDYIFFKLNFDTDFLDPKIFDDEEFKNNILKISYLYQLNEEEMKEVIINTINIDKDLKYTDISKNARIYYQKKNKKTTRQIVTKEPDAFIASQMDDDTFKLVEKLQSLSPAELLEQINNGIKPAISEIKMFEDLEANTKFPTSVINLMILLVNSEKEGVLPGYNYFEKIANTWARAGVQNVVDAINFINKQKDLKENKISKTTTNKIKKKATVPDWYSDYEKQLENLPKKENLSQEEIDKILEEVDDKF